MIRRLLSRFFLRPWKEIDREWIDRNPEASYDWRPLVVLVVVAISLTLQEYFGHRPRFASLFSERMAGTYGELESFAWWSGWRFFGYVVLPLLAIAFMRGERVRDYFIGWRALHRHIWVYLGLFAAVLPAVFVAARLPSFQGTYPFYKLANRSAFDFWVWEALYALQFLSLEFFFRGFMLKALAPKFGSGAIFVMMVPYCMIHYGKPLPETLGAIIAGAVLGTLALRTRSIWGGVLIHCGVALTMDLLSLQGCPPPGEGPCPDH